MELLTLQDVAVTYGKNPTPTVAGINLTVGEGEIVSIVGESGSGKSTVIRAILGLLPGGGRVTQGEILYQGNSLLNLNRKQWRQLRGSDLSMIFQDCGAMLNPTRRIGAQFVEYLCTHQKLSKKEAYARGVELLERMRLPDGKNIMQSYPFQLSGGMRQRVGIAMAMAFQPRLLLGDEPTSALDVTTQAQIVRQMLELREQYGTSIIVVTHNIGVAAYMADHMLVMQQGRVVDAGTREQVLNCPTSEYTKNLLAAVPELGGKRYV